MNRYALLIGNSNYPIDSGLQDLRYPENDIDGMADVLGHKDLGGFNETVKLKNRTTGEIRKEIGKVLSQASRDDLVLFYYSGHGKQDLEGKLYLTTSDTFANDSIELISTALDIAYLCNFIKQSKANKKILILDCCYSGAVGKAFWKGGPSPFPKSFDLARGTYILTASSAVQLAQEKEGDHYGLLTKHIINGIKNGDADINRDGLISMDDLYNYVHEMIGRESLQTPMRWALDVQGAELVVSQVFKERNLNYLETEKLEPPGGAVRLGSPFYISRKADDEFLTAVRRKDTIVLVNGARQMGKTSLLSRGLQQARETGAKVVVTDFQELGYEHFKTLEGFYIGLGNLLADRLSFDFFPEDIWDKKRGATINFGRYIKQLLEMVNTPLVWGLDEVDRLFAHEDGSEVFGLFRSWYNKVKLEPDSPWQNLTMVISYATEASLFIKDLHQSPFNVGTRLTLNDFNKEEVAELNRRHAEPLVNDKELSDFYDLLGGHPFLVRSGLYLMITQQLRFSNFLEVAMREDGLFGDHIRRFIELLEKKPEIKEEVRNILQGKLCSTENFYRLRSAGLMAGESAHDVRPRCRLYEIYLRKHLL
jgi:uncharacterized caspase-like protein